MRSCLAALMLCLVCSIASAAEITIGLASVDDGKPTKYDGGNFTGRLSVAHRDLPLGSCVEVSKLGRDANIHLARIDDRGPCATPDCKRKAPHLAKRLIDLKPKLASAMGCDGLCVVAYWPAPCTSP